MTAVFDALARILAAYEDRFAYEDYAILYHAIQAVHELQHEEGSHRIDSFIAQRIPFRERFHRWLYPSTAEKLSAEVKQRSKQSKAGIGRL